MEARVKGTTDIIEVEFDKDALANDYPPYRTNEIPSRFFLAEQLEWIDIEEKADPDYWTRLEHQYAGMAMQGILSNPESELDYGGDGTLPQALAGCAAKVAHALVEKMKEERK